MGSTNVRRNRHVCWSLLYSVCSEATTGDNSTSKPGMFDLKGKYKWEAWESNKGKSTSDAQQEYIALVDQLKAK